MRPCHGCDKGANPFSRIMLDPERIAADLDETQSELENLLMRSHEQRSDINELHDALDDLEADIRPSEPNDQCSREA